jgi:hypothetical protein
LWSSNRISSAPCLTPYGPRFVTGAPSSLTMRARRPRLTWWVADGRFTAVWSRLRRLSMKHKECCYPLIWPDVSGMSIDQILPQMILRGEPVTPPQILAEQNM